MGTLAIYNHMRETRMVSPALRAMDFPALAARIEATGDESGLALIAAQREYMDSAACSPCARRAAEARLRIWLTRKEPK
jgi:hypothetical protein